MTLIDSADLRPILDVEKFNTRTMRRNPLLRIDRNALNCGHEISRQLLTRTASPLIRPTNETDFDALIALATASGLFEADQTEIPAGMLRSQNENDVWFTDDDGSGPVGVAYMAPEKMTHGTWNLYWIAVHPGHQRNGRGKAILDHVEKWLTEKGERILLVETAGLDDFAYVRKFYADNGFEAEAGIRDFYDEVSARWGFVRC